MLIIYSVSDINVAFFNIWLEVDGELAQTNEYTNTSHSTMVY